MAYYTVDNDVVIDVYVSAARGLEIGFDSEYINVPHPGANKKIQGWEWDRRLWPDQRELEALEYAPSIWDPTDYFLNSGYWQSGIGDNNDLILFSVARDIKQDNEYWYPKLNHGYFYEHKDERYLFSDDYIIEDFYTNQTQSGVQYRDLSFRPKPGVPIKVRRYRRDKIYSKYDLNLDFRKRVYLTGNTASGVEADTLNDDGNISFENIDASNPEFRVEYDYGDTPRVWLNDDYSEAITDSGEFHSYELLGIGDANAYQFYTKYSPVDPSGQFELATYTASGDYTVWQQRDIVSEDFTEGDFNEYKLDHTLGVVTLYSGYPPAAGDKVIARYTKGVEVEYEPEYSRDFIFAREADLNPTHSLLDKGYLTVGLSDTLPASVTLTSDLPTGSNHQASLAGRTSNLIATVKDTQGRVIPQQRVYFELVAPYISSLVLDNAYTDSDGEAVSIFQPPQDIEEMGVYTTEFRHSGSHSIIDVEGLPVPTNESGVLLFEVHREDPVLGFPSSGEDSQLTTYLNGEGIYVTPADQSDNASLLAFEKSYRDQFNLTDTYLIDDTDSTTFSIGRKEIVNGVGLYHINPHFGSQGVEYVSNPEFNAWTADDPDGWTVTGEPASGTVKQVGPGEDYNGTGIGSCNVRKTAPGLNLSQTLSGLTVGKVYDFAIYVSYIKGAISFITSSTGLYRLSFTASATTQLLLFEPTNVGDEFTLDFVSFQERGTLSPIFPIRYSNIGTTTAPDIELVYNTILPALNDELKAYFAITETTDQARAYVVHPYTGRKIYSNTVSIDINIDEESDGIINAATAGDIPSGLFRETRNLNDYTDDWIVTTTSGDLFDTYFETRLASGEMGYKELLVEDKTLALYHLDGDLLDEGVYGLDLTSDGTFIGEAKYEDSGLYFSSTDSDGAYNTDISEHFPYASGTFEMGYRAPAAGYLLGSGSDTEYLTSLLGVDSEGARGGIEIYSALEGVTPYLYFNYLVSGIASYDGYPDYMKVRVDDTDLTDGQWHQLKMTWGYTPDESTLHSGSTDVYGYIDNVSVVGKADMEVGASPFETISDTLEWENIYNGAIVDRIAFGNGVFIGTAGSGNIVRSTDGRTWTKITGISVNTLYDVVFGNGKFVLVGGSSTILTSADGLDWTSQSAAAGGVAFYTAAYGNGLYVIGGAGAEIETSPDGITWTTRAAPGVFSDAYLYSGYGNGTYILIGSGGELHYSTDGSTWLEGVVGGGYGNLFYGVSYGNGVFVVAGDQGQIQYSTDGINWTQTFSDNGFVNQFYGSVFAENKFVLFGAHREVQESTDGINWTQTSLGVSGLGNYYDVVYGLGMFVAGGADGVVLSINNYGNPVGKYGQYLPIGYYDEIRLTSGEQITEPTFEPWYYLEYENYVDWFRRTRPLDTKHLGLNTYELNSEFAGWVHRDAAGGFANSLYGVTYGNSLFVVVGSSGEIQTSEDAITWTSQTADDGYSSTFLNVAYGNGLYLAVGQNAEIQTSTDGETWTVRTPDGGFAGNFIDVVYGSLYIAVGGSGEIQTSSDGTTWTARTNDGGYSDSFYGVIYGGGLYLAVGQSAEIQTSPDGINWTSRTPDGGYVGDFIGATYGDGLYVIVGSSGEIQTSSDGETWTAQTADGGYSDNFYEVTYDGRLYVAVGENGETQTSEDGVTWTSRTAAGGYSGSFLDAFHGNGLLIIVGHNGEIQTAGIIYPTTVPVGFRLKSSDTEVASRVGHRLFFDLNDPLESSYYLNSGLDIYEEYY